MTDKRRFATAGIAAALTVVLPGPPASHAARPISHDASATVTQKGTPLAKATFKHYGDYFIIEKYSRNPDHNRAYVRYDYTRVNGERVTGYVWGLSRPGSRVSVKGPNFGEGRDVAFWVCVQISWADDLCTWPGPARTIA